MNGTERPLDALVIGAGVSGIYALYALLKAGKTAIIVDAAGGVGGTWYWNRYPGLHVDIESVEYSYAFSDELQQEWDWTERYAGQSEIERYLNYVVDRFELRLHIYLNTRVETMYFDDDASVWRFETDDGRQFAAQHAVMGTGLLSAPKDVEFEGLEDFAGEIYKTFDWPREKVSFAGKSVGVVGTGASGVQVIPFVAREARHLNVYQRTPSYAVPLRNCPMPKEYWRDVKQNYDEWRNKERFGSFGGWCAVNYKPVDQVFDLAVDQTPEDREALYEDRWRSGGLAFYNVYPDIFVSKEANDTLAEFLRKKLRERINDPELEKLLIPDYPVLMRRLCGETNYYEVYEQENVDLVDLNSKPLKRFTEKGVIVGDEEHELDAVVFATGYDAMSGALLRMNIIGRGETTLKDHWRTETRTVYGMMASGFPNMFFLSGPGSPAPLFQPILFCQDQMDWIMKAMDYIDESGMKSIDPKPDAEEEWIRECDEKLKATLFGTTESWYVGSNVKGKPGRGLIYFGGIVPYREFIYAAENDNYSGFYLK